jgi:hypothetical protein
VRSFVATLLAMTRHLLPLRDFSRLRFSHFQFSIFNFQLMKFSIESVSLLNKS